MESVVREVTLPADAAGAWSMLSDLGGWFGAEVEGEVALGEVIRIDGRRAVVERMDEPRRLTFRYLDTDPSRVEITVEPIGDRSLVHIQETRIEPAVTPRPEIGFALAER